MQKGLAHPLCALRDGAGAAVDFTLFTMANARAKRDTSDRVVTLLFPCCHSAAKSPDSVTRTHLTSSKVSGAVIQRSPVGVRRIDRASHRQIPRRNKSRSGSIYSELSAESAVYEQIARIDYNGAITSTAIARSGRSDRIFSLQKTVTLKLQRIRMFVENRQQQFLR